MRWMEYRMYRMATAVWLLLAFTVRDVAAQTGDEKSQYNLDVTVIIAAIVGATVVVVIVCVCAGCIYYTRAVKRVRNKIMIRELMNNKNRNDLIDPPEKLATLDNYFKKHEVHAARLFSTSVQIDEDNERQRTEVVQTYGIVKAIDMMFTAESERKLMFKIPAKVDRLYEESEMANYESNDMVTFSDLGEKQKESSCDEKFEPGQDDSGANVQTDNISNGTKTTFLNCQEIDQFFSTKRTTQKRKKKKKNKGRRRKNRSGTTMHSESFVTERSGVEQNFKLHKKRTTARTNTEIVQDYGHSQAKISKAERASSRFRRKTSLQSRNPATATQESGFNQANEKNTLNERIKDAVSTQCSTTTLISGSRIGNVDQIRNLSLPSETYVSVSDIGLDIEQK